MEYKEIKQLMDDMGNSKLSSLDIEFPDGVKISMEKNVEKGISVVTAEKSEPVTINIPKDRAEIKEEETSFKIIKSPMVGTFYASSAPDKPPYVQKGDKIKKGQVVCIVEAMKLMNEIESEFEGEIAEVCIQDGDIVEYGTPLFKII